MNYLKRSFIIFVVINLHIFPALTTIEYAVMENLEATTSLENTLPGQQLSAWELYVLNDLTFQIVMKKCPKISRPTASFLKDYLMEELKMAPNNQQQNTHFLATYAKLLGCFDYLDSVSRNPGKKLDSVHFIAEDKEEDDTEKLEAEPVSEEVQVNSDTENSQWIGQLANNLANLFRWKRDTDNKDIVKDSQAKHKFSKLLHDMNRVVRLSCPIDLKPPAHFFKTVIKETMFWLSQDSHSLTATALKYFKQNSILDQIHECLQAL